MARYIDADDLKLSLKNLPQWGGEVLLLAVLNTVDRQFTADVAPRAEVAREIFDLIEDECLAYPIQEGHPTILVDARNYNELKKKYTEGDNLPYAEELICS